MTFKNMFAGAAVALVAFGGAASATTQSAGTNAFDDGWATWIEYDDSANRGTVNDRDNPLNALGATDGKFFEIGFGSTVTLMFGTLFEAPGYAMEITNVAVDNWPESVDVFVGTYGGAFNYVTSLSNSDAQSAPGAVFNFAGGPYNAVRFVDTSTYPTSGSGGWDIDSVRISAVPVPAAGLLLLTALGGLGFARRYKKS